MIALIELGEAPPEQKKKFACSTCPVDVRKIRRCMDEREDFTSQDGNIWPMYVTQDGEQYGFCPAKSTWDSQVVNMYQSAIITAETGVMWESGPLSKQPDWYVDLLSWFLPMYRDKIFWSRAKVIMGSFAGEKAGSNGNKK